MAEPAGARTAALLLNWRRAELTLQCLGDLLAVDDVALRVLVVDNGSDDGSAATLRDRLPALAAAHPRHRIELAALPHNLGFAGGMNHGLRWAAAQGLAYALVLNNDLRLPPDFLRPLVAALDHDPRVHAIGPTVLQPDGTVWAEGGAVGFGPNALRLHGHGRAPRPRAHGPEPVGFLPGACVLLRVAETLAVGGFDEAYFMYWEDVDLCDRLAARGGRIVWLPWVRVVHDAGQSSGGGRSPLRKFLMACNAVRFLRRRGGVAGWSALVLFDLLLWPLAFAAGPRAAWAKLRGLLAGLGGHRASAADVRRFLPG
ncbi:MAG: glycosyltransferase family 2 protein [Planctomycetes bacterium]|nr:glycosyltransferase family 2 protein [Planctomycetota bacterium]